jgi:two-component system, chemotaxis family, CheB/CheR fusion protein
MDSWGDSMALKSHHTEGVCRGSPLPAGNGGVSGDDNFDWLAVDYLTHTADGILVVNSDGAILCSNTIAEEMFGFEHHELIGKPVEILMPLRLRDGHVAHRRNFMASPRPHRLGQRQNIVGLRRGGSEFPVDISITPVVNGDQTFVVCALRDMSRQRKLEQALRGRTQELQANDQRKDEFITTLAHELRNPLAAASNWIGVLQNESVSPDLRHRALRALQQQNARMRRLIEDLSDISRVRRGEVHLDMRTVDLAQIVRQAAEDYRASINGRRSLTLQLANAPTPVRADQGRLTQVISNLVSNADRYSPNGGDIVISVDVEEPHALLKVRDFGIGIAGDKLFSVFNVFTRLEAAKAACPSGLGLGLSLVKRLVDVHGGSVTAHSEGAGQGSEFVVRLPLAQVRTSREAPKTKSLS